MLMPMACSLAPWDVRLRCQRWPTPLRCCGSAGAGGAPGSRNPRCTDERTVPCMLAAAAFVGASDACRGIWKGHARCRAVLLADATAPSPTLTPLEVVESSMQAWQSGKIQQCISFTSSRNRQAANNMDDFETILRLSSPFKPIVGCYSFETLSALSISPSQWQCRVRIEASEDKRIVGARTVAKYYRWELSKQMNNTEFDLGQCLRHRKHGYRGVIIGYDDVCMQPEEWCQHNDVDELTKGRSQPFYHVLVDGRDMPGKQIT